MTRISIVHEDLVLMYWNDMRRIKKKYGLIYEDGSEFRIGYKLLLLFFILVR